MNQTEQAKQVIHLGSLCEAIPTADKMVSVKSLLSAKDLKFIKDNGIGDIAIGVNKEIFFLSQLHKVPSISSIVRHDAGQNQGQLIGLAAVIGG